MQELLMGHESARDARDGWMDDNARGLALAATADWDEAAEAFAAAADAMARRAPEARSHDALGLVLSNLAQACFRAGRTREGLAHAQRACAIRVALLGEDAVPVARARMDLAVMLGSVGRLDEAQALLQRATAAMERHAGDDDARLVVMLENAARLALAAGSPANAEPLLLRLHALLDAHGMSTDRADRLLGLVASSRGGGVATTGVAAPAVAMAAVEEPLTMAVVDEPVVEVSAATEPAPALGPDDWEYEPLHEAVVLTDVLLRTTPSGVIAVAEAVQHDAEVLAAFERVPAARMEPAEEVAAEPVMEPISEPIREPMSEAPPVSDETDAIVLDLADDFAVELTDDFGVVAIAPDAATPGADGGAETAEGAESFGLDFAVDFAEDFADDAAATELGADHAVVGGRPGDVSTDANTGRTGLLGFDLDDALADSLVDVPTRVSPAAPRARSADESLVLEPVMAMASAVPVVVSTPMPASPPMAEPLSALDAPLKRPVHPDETPAAFGFGPPPAVVPPIGQSSVATSGTGTVRGQTDRATSERGRAEHDATDELPRLRPPRGPRPTFPPEPPPSKGAGRLVLVILGTVVTASAAGGAAWYFLLR